MSGTVLAGQKLLAATLGVPPWTPMAGSYTNSWSDFGAGNANGQYRKWALMNEVEIIGSLSHASISGNSAFFTVPAALFPSSAQVAGFGATSSGAVVSITISTAGVLLASGLPAATTSLQFHGWYSLDA